MSKKIIGVDIDDVLIDFNKSMLEFHNQEYGTKFKIKDIVEFRFERLWNCSTEEVYKRVVAFYNSPLHAQIRPIPGAIETIKKLALEYELVAISARPTNTLNLTKRLLNLYFKGSIKKIILTNEFALKGIKKNKAEVCQKLKAAFLIDDSLANALACSQKKIPVILLSRAWNQSMSNDELIKKGIYPAKNWSEVVKILPGLDI